MIHSKTPGRPKRHPLDAFKTIAWYGKMEVISGMGPRELEREFDGTPNSSLLSKYSRGLATPSPDVIKKVEAAFPGSAVGFSHPVWQLLEPRWMTPPEFKDCFLRLGKEARDFFLVDDPENQFVWRQPRTWTNPYRKALLLEYAEDSLASYQLLLEEAIIRQSPKDLQEGLYFWKLVRSRMMTTQLFTFSPEIQKSIFPTLGLLLEKRWSVILGPDAHLGWDASAWW